MGRILGKDSLGKDSLDIILAKKDDIASSKDSRVYMHAETRRRPQLSVGSGNEMAVRLGLVFRPLDGHAEWELLVRAHHNVLLAGPSAATSAMLASLEPHIRQPIRLYTPKTGVPVPHPLEGTLVLLEVARLDGKQQGQLLRWLDRFDERTRVQVVSTTAEPIFSLVEAGAFLADLYYRLNVLRIDATPSGESLR